MTRELARPMTLDSQTVLLPYLPLLTSDDARGQGPAPPLGFKLPRDPQVSSLLAGLLGGPHALLSLVDFAAATMAAAACPAYLCREDGRGLVIYGGHAVRDPNPFPTWRLEAIAALRHLRADCVWIAGCDLSDAAWAVEGRRSPEGARFYRCDQDYALEPEDEEGEEGGAVTGGDGGLLDGSASARRYRHQHHEQQEGQGRVLASMPPLLKHLLSNTDADCPGYVVKTFSTQGADVWAPFPTHPPLSSSSLDREGEGGEGVGGAAAAGASLDASGSGSGKWWKRALK